MATLTSDVSASARLLLITGDTSAAALGREYRIDDEVVTLRSFQRLDSKGHPSHIGTPNANRWVVTRGDAGSHRAAHTAGATIVGVLDAYAVSTTLVPPTPFAGTGEGSGVAAFVEPTTATPEAIAQALIDAGLMDAS